MNYFLIPGNPPAVHFYDLWSQEIMHLQPDSKVQVSLYPHPSSHDSSRVMKEIAEAHTHQLREFHHQARGPITVMGHSLGGYFSMRLLESAEECIERVVLLHPFLRAPDLRGKMILKAIAALQPQESVKALLLKSKKLIQYWVKEVEFVSDEEILKLFALGMHEAKTIAQDVSAIEILPRHRTKIHLFYNSSDSWCRMEVVNQLKHQVFASECPEPHGFITDKKFRLSLFEKILKGFTPRNSMHQESTAERP